VRSSGLRKAQGEVGHEKAPRDQGLVAPGDNKFEEGEAYFGCSLSAVELMQ
jgi:hypothetical protein